MCGIAGFCNIPDHWETNIRRMNERMYHRGPDAGGYWTKDDHSIVLGHRRLSIVDLSSCGAQPMTSASGRMVIVYNGEIYNYKELSKRLLKDGHVKQFRGQSDTEVLLEAFEAYGIEETLRQCKGMFAIALYDKQEKALYLMRDRIGEKPLYYGNALGGFVFASDLGSIESMQGYEGRVNEEVLGIYFIHGYIPAPYSIYHDIYKLEPGTYLRYDEATKTQQTRTYWNMLEVAKRGQDALFTGSFEEAVEECERLLKQSIKDQMVADVPVGAFLSAGIDSSTVVALMQSLSPGRKVRTFTIGTDDGEKNEAVAAKAIAQHIGSDHTELYISQEEAMQVIPKLAGMYSEPFADSSQIPTYLVSKMTREHVTVSLSGDAGDELFCGYNSYRSIERIWNKLEKVPYAIRRPVSVLASGVSPLGSQQFRTKSYLLGAKTPEHLYERSNQEEPLSLKIARERKIAPYKQNTLPQDLLAEVNHRIMLVDMKMYLPDDILVKVDRAAMAVSLETRVPMLDRDVVEFAWTLPIDYKKKDGVGKQVLREVLYRHVPKDLMERPKTGFSIPIDRWLRTPQLLAWADSLLDPEKIRRQGLLSEKVVSRIWNDYKIGGQWRIQIWYLLMFQEWMEQKGREA